MSQSTEGLVAGRYRLGEVLGRGGMGEVRRATDELLGREVAVKLMLPVPRTLAAAERFVREARATARIHSPHVVAAYDFGAYGDGYYLAMELVSGRTVADELKRTGLFSPEQAVRVVREAAAGLAAAHRQGIVHRDVKASNLLLADDGTVKVADFGIVRFLHDTTTTLTSTGQIVGTSHYLAPERVLGRPAEPPSDVYALGCVLYQLVTGHPPFMGEAPASIMYQHVQNEPVPPSDLRPELAGELEDLIFWMLDKDPLRRPTAAQVAAGDSSPITANLDAVTTEVLPVRRTTSRPVLAGLAAATALAVSATLGILLDTKGTRLPTTNELLPGNGTATTPAVVPTTRATPKTTGPVPTASSSRPTTQQQTQDDSGPGKAKAGPQDRPAAEKGVEKGGEKGVEKGGEEAKSDKPGKPKKKAG
ncbi:serine/threonine-protein kinase [Kribbella sp. NPDC023972]|uniref:serine/threonine-protein kinase n=1 Tax=Kribbella sp. NPDC023972 TaxID=3154795 RepID=UPI0033E2C7BB